MTKRNSAIAAWSLWSLLSGCSTTDPYERPHMWHPTGANEANLAAMLVNPADFARGRGTGPTEGTSAVSAIDRLRQDRLKPLSGTNGPAAVNAGTGGTTN